MSEPAAHPDPIAATDLTAATPWAVVLAVKLTSEAKSRLRPLSSDDDAHLNLVAAIRADTLAAVRACPTVGRVVIVGDQGEAQTDQPPVDVVQQTPGLNGAFADAVRHLRRDVPDWPVAALVADLPALHPDNLREALTAALNVAHGFVRDAEGSGTTMVTARDSVGFTSRFGPDSAARHAAGMVELPAAPGLRSDIDTAADLQAALRLGVGPHTASLLARVGYASLTSTRHD